MQSSSCLVLLIDRVVSMSSKDIRDSLRCHASCVAAEAGLIFFLVYQLLVDGAQPSVESCLLVAIRISDLALLLRLSQPLRTAFSLKYHMIDLVSGKVCSITTDCHCTGLANPDHNKSVRLAT